MEATRNDKDGNGSGRDSVTGKFLPGHRGGPGRPKGRAEPKRDKYMTMLDQRAPEVLKKLLALAESGDMTAIKVVVDRILPAQTLAVSELQDQIEELREKLECHRSLN